MPIYEYHCPKCRETFEELRKSVDDDVAPCPVCGEPSGRIISNSAFILKGGGWYATTYKDRRPEFIQRGGRPKIKGVSATPEPETVPDGAVRIAAPAEPATPSTNATATKPSGPADAKKKNAAKSAS